MALVDRVKNICLTPTSEWPVIAQEPASSGNLITGYVVPLAAIGSAAGFIGGSLVGRTLPFVGTYRIPIVSGLLAAIFTFVIAIVACFVISLIINALAPTFGAAKNSDMALKVAVYSYTPAWVAGALQILPTLGTLAMLVGGLYSLYLLYLGLPRLMKCPEDKAIGYTIVTVICAIVISVVLAAIGGLIGLGAYGVGRLTTSAAGGGGIVGGSGASSGSGTSSEVQFDRNSTLGKLQELGNKLEESNKKAEAAQKAGDQAGATAAAFEGLGTLLGGGKHVDPIEIDQIKPFIPDTFAGLSKKSGNVNRNGVAGLMVTQADATYSDGAGKTVTLEISDTGGASGLVSLGTWVGLTGEQENDEGTERTSKINGRIVHEKTSKRGGPNEFAIVLGERFIVSANGQGFSLAELRTAVNGLDLAKLEAMKDVGVQK